MRILNNVTELMDFLGIKEGDTVNIVQPQFEREYKLNNNFKPTSKKDLEFVIKNCSSQDLKGMGVEIWDSYDNAIKNKETTKLKPNEIHYLFPGEWYDFIPEKFEIICIDGKKELFENGKTDYDIRFGCLPYGFVRNF